MAFDKKKFIGRFAQEANEHIAKLNEGLLALEKGSDDEEVLNQVFRSAHTIKGSSRILSLNEITEVAHKLEDILDGFRAKEIEPSKALYNVLFKAVDVVGSLVEQIQSDQEIDIDVSIICNELDRAVKGEVEEPEPPKVEPAKTAPVTETKQDAAVETAPEKPAVSEEPQSKETPQPEASPKTPLKIPAEAIDPETIPRPEASPQAPKKAPAAVVKPKSEETIRIHTGKLDETIKLMGEMVSSQNQMRETLSDLKEIEQLAQKHLMLASKVEKDELSSGNGQNSDFFNSTQLLHSKIKQLDTITKDILNLQSLLNVELREKVLNMRMLPIWTVLDSFPRLVRDISASFGKNIDFIIEGGETELDKKIIEQIGDPLLHMIRNSVDHGIESPEERLKAGKPEMATLRISASYEGGNMLIEVSDDGAGIPIEKIREKALQRKLFDEAKLKNMPEAEIIDLIFRPGFSTSPIITDISGRGVGMDVVRKNIVEQLKGSIQVQTAEGKGTVFSIRLPLTLAVMRVLTFTILDSQFAIAVNYVKEILKVPKSEIIEVVDKKAIRVREQIIPIVDLENILDLPEGNKTDSKDVLVVLVAWGSETLGLVINSLISEEDVEIKPMPSHMKSIELVAGATLTGKNEIILLLHVPRVFVLAKEVKERKRLGLAPEEEKKAKTILVVDDSINTREIEKSILESYGYKVDIASDGVDGFEKAMEFQYDLIVSDIEMPRMDGFSLIEKLRKESEYKHIPIIIVSSRDKEEDKKRGIQVGADAYIIKGSFDQSNLLNTVQNLVD